MIPGLRRGLTASVVLCWAVAASPAIGASPGPATAATPAPGEPSAPSVDPQEALPDPTHPGASLRVFLLTAGQGDLIWEEFGHNGIRIVDPEGGTDEVWEWGIFDFAQENFWPRLVAGEMLYSMGRATMDDMLFRFEYFGRPVWQQELRLTPEQKWRLKAAVLENYRPENREYLYDYYRDNCSTRVRDMLDLVLDGALRAELGGDTTATTFRWHTRRLLGRSPLGYAGIQLVLGNPADRPITAWEETFLPMKLQAHLRDVTVRGPDGSLRPLVGREVQLVEAARPPTPTAPPSALGWFASVGLALAVLSALLAEGAGSGRRGSRLLLAILGGSWSLLAGVGGVLILGAWLFTGHDFWGWNENLLQTSPLSLALAVAFAPLLWRRHLPRWTAPLAAVVAGLSFLGFVLQPLPGLDQVNGEIIALALPANLGLAWTAARLSARGPEPRSAEGAAALPEAA